MSSTLRHIAVHVEEPEPGAFRWVLTERARGDTWREIDWSAEDDSTFRQAMASGLLALQALVDDLDAGPRIPPASPAADDGPEEDGAPPAARPSLFGFGPAR